jgi:hypothetical protein
VTAAQIRSAALLVENAALMDNEIVTLVELGSEGAIFYTGTFGHRGVRHLIARDGTVSTEPSPVSAPHSPGEEGDEA